MEEAFLFAFIIGAWAIYSMVHFYVVQFTKRWSERTSYEKFITVLTAVLLVLVIFGQ